ncbi:hypothetical protein SeLEV6574_g06287 [Synchytrium endobioticum]|nr:hypothetical protein SeLEV6574_g06287 [Synchytrium endobioticum]
MVAFSKPELLINLDGTSWTASNRNGSIAVPAEVPGEIHTDLMRARIIDDPYVRDNHIKYRWIALDEWTFQTTFTLPAHSLQAPAVLLVCEGLDTIAHIVVNGKSVGYADNQFRRWIYDVGPALMEGSNELAIRFESAISYAARKASRSKYVIPDMYSEAQHGERNRSFIRKEQSSFSWDWGPCFAPCGIWKSIYILPLHSAIWISDICPQVSRNESVWNVKVTVWMTGGGEGLGYVELQAQCAGIQSEKHSVGLSDVPGKIEPFTIELEVPTSEVEQWWPMGYGEQPLYELTVLGQMFGFEVNGVPIFAKGSNFIPADCFESRVTKEKLRMLLQSCVEANHNMIRVWGGGIYQQDAFYDLCDELGLMVWQEFLFACALYPTDTAFISNVRKEVEHQLKRLMHHVSIVLWSGNNENEEALITGWFDVARKNPQLYAIDYDRLYHQCIMEKVKEMDKVRPYISSSPSNGIVSDDPYTERFQFGSDENELYGDIHNYNYRDDGTDVSKMPCPRFASEYGFQAMPSFTTMRTISSPADWHSHSPFMMMRNHRKNGQDEMLLQIRYKFKWPIVTPLDMSADMFDQFCYLSQCSQAMTVRAQTEHYRRLRGVEHRCMGALYWQCNDIWQAPTWSGIEFNGRWKMLHYYSKKFFAPILVSSYEVSKGGAYEVHISNDTCDDIEGELTIELHSFETAMSHVVKELPVSCQAVSSKCVASYEGAAELARSATVKHDAFFTHTLRIRNEVVATSEYFPDSFDKVRLQPVTIKISNARASRSGTSPLAVEYAITFDLEADAVAVFVWLEFDDRYQGRFSDNGFVLLPGMKKFVEYKLWDSTLFDLMEMTSVKWDEVIRIRSLQDAQKWDVGCSGDRA